MSRNTRLRPCATNVAISRTSGQRMSRSYDTSHRPPANPGSSCTRPVIAASSAVGSGAGTTQTRVPISAATRRKTSEGRRARGASLEDEKTRMRYRGVSGFGRGVGSSTGTGSGTASTSPNVKSSPRPAPVRHRRGAYTLPAAVRPNSRCVRKPRRVSEIAAIPVSDDLVRFGSRGALDSAAVNAWDRTAARVLAPRVCVGERWLMPLHQFA